MVTESLSAPSSDGASFGWKCPWGATDNHPEIGVRWRSCRTGGIHQCTFCDRTSNSLTIRKQLCVSSLINEISCCAIFNHQILSIGWNICRQSRGAISVLLDAPSIVFSFLSNTVSGWGAIYTNGSWSVTIHDISFDSDLLGRGDVIENNLAIGSRVWSHTAGCSQLAGYGTTVGLVYERREDFGDLDNLGSSCGGVIQLLDTWLRQSCWHVSCAVSGLSYRPVCQCVFWKSTLIRSFAFVAEIFLSPSSLFVILGWKSPRSVCIDEEKGVNSQGWTAIARHQVTFSYRATIILTCICK